MRLIPNRIFGFESAFVIVGPFGLAKMRTTVRSNFGNVVPVFVEHFLSHLDHCYTDMQLIPLELIYSSRDPIRKARESINPRGPVLSLLYCLFCSSFSPLFLVSKYVLRYSPRLCNTVILFFII